MHVRRQISAAVVSRVTGLTTTAARVFKSRVYPLTDAEMPGLCVYARSDQPNYESSSLQSIVWHELELIIEGYVKGSDDDTLDTIAEEVETALYTDQTFSGLAAGIEIGPQEIGVEGEGDKMVGVIQMGFKVFYRAAEGVPGTAK